MFHQTLESPVFISSLILSMFILSGNQKISTFQSTVNNFEQKINLTAPKSLYQLIIFLVIILEMIAPIFVIYYFLTNKFQNIAYYSVVSLIIFTILATLVYHPPDFSSYYKSLPFWANISLIGGLLLLLKLIKSKTQIM